MAPTSPADDAPPAGIAGEQTGAIDDTDLVAIRAAHRARLDWLAAWAGSCPFWPAGRW